MKANQQIKQIIPAGIRTAFVGLFFVLWFCADVLAQDESSFNTPGGVHYNADGTLSLQWTGPGTLESAPGLAGPWTAVSSGSSYAGNATVPASGTAGFFRLHSGSRIGAVFPAPVIPALPAVQSATIQRLN
ncbi:MAG TPA: hypothetical protein VG754_02150, partial [Verrucomicrobiae bacterium]|nr:hypothetical protein [Verrucomicrobiae bacterium]